MLLKMAKKTDAIQVQNISKNFDIVKAVDNISFAVKEREIFGFLGPNGAGKTTTIRMLTGVLEPSMGKIIVYGKDAWQNQIMVKQIMGNVPEMANVYLDLTGLQNLKFIGEIYGVPKKECVNRADNLLKQFKLYPRKDDLAKKYSKGMKQRLLLCMALMSNPKILFLDEPTSGLDVQSSIIIKKLIKEYNNKGMTIFLTTHDMNVADELCDRIAIINKGVIVKIGTPYDLRRIEKSLQILDVEFSGRINDNKLTNLPWVEKVRRLDKTRYELTVKELHESLSKLINFCRTEKIKINEINTPEPSLQEVFIKIISGDKN